MDRFFKRVIAFAVCILAVFALYACNGADFSELQIIAEDATDVPEGEYTLQYSIKDYEKFLKDFNLTLTVRVFDEKQNAVEVKNNRTVKIEKNKTYSVNIICSAQIDGEIKTVTKIFTVAAVRKPSIYLYAGSTPYGQPIPVAAGSTYPIEEFEFVPDHYPAETAGIKRTIISKKWTVEIDGKQEDLTQSHLENIQSDVFIRAVYVYKEEAVKLKLQYFANGGFIEDDGKFYDEKTYELPFYETIYFNNLPKRDGYIFDGWYTDEKLTSLLILDNYKRMTLTKNMKLYAKWIEERNVEWNELYEFTKDNDLGYDYYTVKFIGNLPADGKVLLPVGKDNIPVRGLTAFAFSGKAVTSVTIPASYDLNIYGAFADCASLTEVKFENGSQLVSISDKAFRSCTALKSISIPEGVVNIDAEAFYGCSALEDVSLTYTIVIINREAFYGCSSLKVITVPDKVTRIYQSAFADCTSLENLNIGEKSLLSFISVGAFDNTAITSVTLPYAIKNINNPFPEGSGVTVTYFPELKEED